MPRRATADQVSNVYKLLHQFAKSNPRFERGAYEPTLPPAGVYVFLDPDEPHPDSQLGRVVRIGTHGIREDLDGSLILRLRKHYGSRSGRGAIAGSVFRTHVGKALVLSKAPTAAKWDDLACMVRPDFDMELAVSQYIRRMNIIVVPIGGTADTDSDREFLERHAVAFFCWLPNELAHVSEKWLGHDAEAPKIRRHGLWNVEHIEAHWDKRFIELLAAANQNQNTPFTRGRHPLQRRLE